MARKSTIPPAEQRGPEFVGKTPEVVGKQEIVAREMQAALDEVLALGVGIGGMQALDFIATVANSTILPVYENIKKTKAWRLITNPKSCDGRNFESFDEFCEIKLGKSYRRLQELVSNRNAIGQDAYEQAENLGLRQSDYNIIKALPAPKQEILKQALADGADLETVTNALRRLAAVDQQEIDDLTNANANLKSDYDAQGMVIQKKDEKINAQETQIHKLQKRIQTATPDEVGNELRAEVSQLTFNAEAAILGALTEGFISLDAHAQDNNCTHEEFMSGCLCQIERALAGLRGRFNVKSKPDGDAMPDWLRPGAEEAAAAAVAAAKKQTAKN